MGLCASAEDPNKANEPGVRRATDKTGEAKKGKHGHMTEAEKAEQRAKVLAATEKRLGGNKGGTGHATKKKGKSKAAAVSTADQL